VIIEPVEDLDVAAVGQGPVGEIGLPAFIGLLGLETDVGAFGPFTRLRGDQDVVVRGAGCAGSSTSPSGGGAAVDPCPAVTVTVSRAGVGVVLIGVQPANAIAATKNRIPRITPRSVKPSSNLEPPDAGTFTEQGRTHSETSSNYLCAKVGRLCAGALIVQLAGVIRRKQWPLSVEWRGLVSSL
jgi:hypothetical protein